MTSTLSLSGAPSTGGCSDAAACERDALYAMCELPAVWALLRFFTPPSARVPELGEIVRALREPLRHAALIAQLHARVLGLQPSAAEKLWLVRLRELAHMYACEYRVIFGAFSEPTSADGEHDADTDSQPAEPHFPPLAGLRSYDELTAEQRLRLLHTTAELVLYDPKLCGAHAIAKLSARTADELRLGCMGHDSMGNDYYYFGDRQHLFREPGRFPRARSFAPSLNAADEEKRRKERERQKRQQDAERRRVERERLEEERRLRNEERKRAAEQRRELKEARARKREEERRRREREARVRWAQRHPNARSTRSSRRVAAAAAAAAAADKSEDMALPHAKAEDVVELVEQNSDTPEAKCESELALANGNREVSGDEGHANGTNVADAVRLPADEADETALSRATGNTLACGNGATVPSRTSKRKRRSTPVMAAYVESLAGGTNDELSAEDEHEDDAEMAVASTVSQDDASLRACVSWEVVCSSYEELQRFVARFGDASRIKNADERALVRRLRDVLLPEFEENARACQRRRERMAKHDKPVAPVKKSSRLLALEMRREAEAMQKQKQKLETRKSSRKRRRTK